MALREDEERKYSAFALERDCQAPTALSVKDTIAAIRQTADEISNKVRSS